LLVPLPGGPAALFADDRSDSLRLTHSPSSSSEELQLELDLHYPSFQEVFLDLLQKQQKAPEIQSTQLAIEDGLQKIESDSIEKLPAERRDHFHLGQQKLFIEGQEYSLYSEQLEIPIVSYNKIDVAYDRESRVLSFLAIRGGNVVARHEIHGLDIASWTEDAEHLLLLSSEGRLSVIDRFILHRVCLFKSPVPVFKNIAKDLPVSVSEGFELKIDFRNPGLKPFAELEASHPDHEKILLPRDEEGQVLVSSKDTVVYSEHPESGERHLHAILSKDVTYEKVQEGILVLSWLSFLAYLKLAPAEEQQELLTAWLKQKNLPAFDEMNSEERSLFEVFSPQSLGVFLGRYKATGLLKGRNFDLVRPGDWQQQFSEIAGLAAQQVASGKNRDGHKHSSEFLEQLAKDSTRGSDFGNSWQEVVRKGEPSNMKGKAKKALIALGAMVGVGTAFSMGSSVLPASFKESLVYAQGLQVMNWLYSFWPSDVWANKEYRTPLIMSITCLIGTLPLGLALSWASIPFLKYFAKWTKPFAPKFSALLQEKHDIYSEMGVAKRILTVGMRICSWITLPVQHILIDKAFRQKFLFPAIRRGINPFKRIQKNSELGKQLQLEHNHFVGWKVPGSGKKEAEKEKILLALSAQKNKAERLANLFALLLVSEDKEVTPQMLLDFLSTQKKSASLERFFANRSLQSDWLELSEGLQKMLGRENVLASTEALEKLDRGEFARLFKQSLEIHKELKGRSASRKAWDQKFLGFHRAWKNSTQPVLKWAVDHGKFEHEFLRTVIPNDFTAKQVSWEYIIDQTLTIFYSSFWGARADLSKLADPSQAKTLAADIHGNIFNLYTNREQLYDVIYNGIYHVVGSSSNNTLVFFQEQAFADPAYTPYETASGQLSSRDEHGKIKERAESFWQSVKNGVKALHPKNSDLGGVYVKEFISRLACIHFYFLLSFSFRLTIGEQNMDEAFRAFLYTFISTNWLYNWPWKMIYVATQGNEDHVHEFVSKFQSAKEKVAQGIRLKKTDLLTKGYDELFGLMQRDPNFKEEFTDALLKNEEFKKTLDDPQTRAYMEALRDLLVATQEEKPEAQAAAKARILEFYKGVNLELSGEALLDYALRNPPQATKVNPWFQKALIAGASILTTALAVPMVDKSFRAEELTGEFLASNAAFHAGLYALFYVLLDKKTHDYVGKGIRKVGDVLTGTYARLSCQNKLLP
jgi:hypothetical protein